MDKVKGAGFVYILQNEVYAPYVVKIGFSSREPDIRAHEIYRGSTGVPVPFRVVAAYSVGACEVAEKEIHKALKAYRINKKREFFRLPPSVAISVVFSECSKLNGSLGLGSPVEFFKKETVSVEQEGEIFYKQDCSGSEEKSMSVPLSCIQASPIGMSMLTAEQKGRVAILSQIFSQVYPDACDKWNEDFSRDSNPENEIVIWESMAKAFLTIDELYLAGDGLKKEAFWLLLQRSWCSTGEVLKKTKLEYFELGQARRFLGEYELKPRPLVVTIKHAPAKQSSHDF